MSPPSKGFLMIGTRAAQSSPRVILPFFQLHVQNPVCHSKCAPEKICCFSDWIQVPKLESKIHKLSWIEWLCPYLRGPGAWSFGKAEFEQVAFGKIATDALKSASKTSSAWWRFICGMWCVSFDIYCTWTNAIDCNCIICCRHTEKILIIIT